MSKKTIFSISLCFLICICSASDLYINQDTTLTDTLYISGTKNIHVNNSRLIFDNKTYVNQGTSSLKFYLAGGIVQYTSDAAIDNNMDNFSSARTLLFTGESYETDSLIFDTGFIADNTGFDTNYAPEDQPHWIPDGFSSMRLTNLTLLTQHTQSHPSIHKKRSIDSSHTHHGVIRFAEGGESRWVIKGEDQFTDCQIIWDTLTLITKKNLSFEGYSIGVGANVYFTGKYLTKLGMGTLSIKGSQGYDSGSVINVLEGKLQFYSNPAIYRDNEPKMKGLNLSIGAEGACYFNDTEADIASLYVNGKLLINKASIRSTSSVLLDENSTLILENTPSEYPIQSDSLITLKGKLDIPYGTAGQRINIASSSYEITGSFDSITSGFTIYYEGDKVYAIQDTSLVNNVVYQAQESLPIISYFNAPTNPYFIANYTMQNLLLSLRSVNGQLLDIKTLSVIENEVIYLQKVFPLLNRNTMYLLQCSNNNKRKTVRVIYK